MLQLRKREEQGHTRIDWLDSHHVFSFGDYYAPEHRGFSDLRVINDDIIRPASGFGTHPHNDMEIVTFVISGALEHRDSMGNGSVIRPGDIQRMSAGLGVTHSEFNPSETEPARILQVWIFPESKGLHPGYEQRHFDEADMENQLRLMASREGQDGSVVIHQDAGIHRSVLTEGRSLAYDIQTGRSAWIQVIEGHLRVNETTLEDGDGMGVTEGRLELTAANGRADFLLFDLRHPDLRK